MSKLWQWRNNATGATVEEPPDNPWLRRPEGIHEEQQHAEAMQVIREQLMRELRAAERVLDLRPQPHDAQRLQRLYAVDKSAPSGEMLLKEVAQACGRMRDFTWSRILERLEQAHRERAGAAEQELADIANGASETQPNNGGMMSMVRDALRRDGSEGEK